MGFQTSTVSIGNNTKKSDYDTVMNNTKALKDENLTISGIKTFQSATIFNGIATLYDSVRRITSANYIHANETYNNIFDKVAPFIPTNGDVMLVTGLIGGTVSHVIRTDATTITFYSISSVGNLLALAIGDGVATTTNVSIAW